MTPMRFRQIVVAVLFAPTMCFGQNNLIDLNKVIQAEDIKYEAPLNVHRLLSRPELFTVETGSVKATEYTGGMVEVDIELISITPNKLWYSGLEELLAQDSTQELYEKPSVGNRVVKGLLGFIPFVAAGMVYGQAASNKFLIPDSRSMCLPNESNDALKCYSSSKIDDIMGNLRRVKIEARLINNSGSSKGLLLGASSFSMVHEVMSDVPYDGPYMSKKSEFLVIEPTNTPKNLGLRIKRDLMATNPKIYVQVAFVNPRLDQHIR